MDNVFDFAADEFDPGKSVFTFRNSATNEAVMIRVPAIESVLIDTESLRICTESMRYRFSLAGLDAEGNAAIGLLNTIQSQLR
ncbi:MAG: hypothetical protein EA403_07395 [Spirochaetaceae bacterium]|nr:MAG: hypothetical protein EA403_07395 [Spirochaetaceae bacterium]